MTYQTTQHLAAGQKPLLTWRYLRILASFALFGAIVMGLVAGVWHPFSFDQRLIGAGIGALVAIVLQARYEL
jgi:hypothetical protein